MNSTKILLTRVDAEKLISDAQREGYRGSPYLKMLAGEIDKAQIVELHEISLNGIRRAASACCT